MNTFEGVRVFKLPFDRFKNGAAVTIPGLGIFVGKGHENDLDLIRHEFGHILQFRKWGFRLFWKHIAADSLKSAKNALTNRQHMQTWTEWSANRLAYDYFQQPEDWDMLNFPIKPSADNLGVKPKFARNNEAFEEKWLDA
ncbi:MAG: hypothetical protein ACK5KP_01055 [Paludibacteraceae bacterium]